MTFRHCDTQPTVDAEQQCEDLVSFDCALTTHIPAVPQIWHESFAQLQQLVSTNPLFQFLQHVGGGGSLTSLLTGSLPSIQEVFFDGRIGLRVGESSRSDVLVQVETMPPVGLRLNEDAFLVEKSTDGRILILGVIDGATSQKPIMGIAPASGAFLVSHLVAYLFPQSSEWRQLAASKQLSASDLLTVLNPWLKQQLQTIPGVSYEDALTIPGAAGTFVTLNLTTQTGTFAHVADTMLALEMDDGSIQVLTDNKNEHFDHQTGELVTRIAQERGISYLEAAQDPRVKAQLAESFLVKISTPNGCGILNGMPELFTNTLVQSGTFSLEGVRRVLLLSDGAYAPWQQLVDKNLQLPMDFNRAIDQIRNGGGHTPLSITARVIQTDVLAATYKRLKPQDDATFLAVDLL